MTCFRLGNPKRSTFSAYGQATPLLLPTQSQSQQPRPFVEFSPHRQDRANLMTSVGTGLGSATSLLGSRRRRRASSTSAARSRKRSLSRRRRKATGRTRISRVRVVKGQVSLRVGGHPGVQRLRAGQLLPYLPLNKLRAAAKRVLGRAGGRVSKRRRGVRRRRRVGRRRVGRKRQRSTLKRRRRRRRRV